LIVGLACPLFGPPKNEKIDFCAIASHSHPPCPRLPSTTSRDG
jgi:hypothetical protein